MSSSNPLSNQVAFNEAVAEVSCEPIKKHVQEGIGNTNRKPPKRSKRKQTFGANNLPEIDDNNTISERVEIIHKTVGVNNFPKIDDHEISEGFEVNCQSRKTYERKRSRNVVSDNITLRKEPPLPQETDNIEYSQKTAKRVPVCRAIINAGKGVKRSEIFDNEISESFEVNRQTFGANNLPEIDDNNTISERVEIIHKTVGVNNFPKIDDHEIREGFEVNRQSRKTYERKRSRNIAFDNITQSRKTYELKRSRNIAFDNITLRKEPLPQETDNIEYSQKTAKRVPVCRAIINAGKGVKRSEIFDNEISESFEVNRQSRREEAKSPETDSLEQSQNAVKSFSQFRTIISARRGVRKRQRRTEDKFESCESRERCRLNEELFTPDELACLEKAGVPHPITSEQLVSITEAIYKEYHSEIVVCAVCDEMFSYLETKLMSAADLPISFFSVLRKPFGLPNEVPALHPLLLQQYDVSHYFPADPRFQGLLISPRGLEIHRKKCLVKNQNCCESQLYICVTNGCLTALQHNKIPKVCDCSWKLYWSTSGSDSRNDFCL
ncbi:hypothetical protein DAPPUDRAFT_325614 [Daphnia pulex]|uniref:Uncharacterized protein n=1 Tax=Daphnia pulex TaxID=6669 RepID=E9H598_DAPPU|nr:hypothetical protein DAPPUDRAFT_325614 [Daphnia pulex]|eukprot:EFX73114.1 hypothetical protein DAPPUDRAFT_325614 [Daphnia pulex]